MPSTSTITAFHSFTPSTLIRSSEMNTNLSAIRGHFIPVDPSASSAAPAFTYDLGGYGHEWRGVYGQYLTMYGNTAGSVPALPTTTAVHIYAKSDGKVYKASSAGETEIGSGGGGVLTPIGSRASPNTITAAGGISWTTTSGDRQIWWIRGATTTGVDVSADPQITVGATIGQELIVVGMDDSRTVTLEDGDGLDLNGPFVAYDSSSLHLCWDGTNWFEIGRRD